MALGSIPGRGIMTRKCTKCGFKKKLKDFYYKKTQQRYTSHCKPCTSQVAAERLRRKKIKAINLLGGECQKCGYNQNFAALDFHHKDPNKKDMIWADMKNKCWETIIVELKKCTLLCKNCHAETHWPECNIID